MSWRVPTLRNPSACFAIAYKLIHAKPTAFLQKRIGDFPHTHLAVLLREQRNHPAVEPEMVRSKHEPNMVMTLN